MAAKVNVVLKKVLENVKPAKEELEVIKKALDKFVKDFNSSTKKLKIAPKGVPSSTKKKDLSEKGTEIFVGGSFAKNTVIKKNYYDVDVFVRFDKHYNEEKISEFTKKILMKVSKNFKIVHGSRDYFRIRAGPKFFIEIIPVIKIDKPKQALNITDLSYSHVKYINKKAKGKILDEILLAKAFCYANKCYGAESYINGFSGYSLELLICYYKNFLNFIKAVSKIKTKEKLIIDIEKKYKNKGMILIDVNSSKLQSPIILIDPTFKHRNASAALSEETFEKFKIACKAFLKNPTEKAFEIQKTDLEKIKNNAIKNKNEFILLEGKTNKQWGDVAGSKLLKFYNHLTEEIKEFFVIKNKGFNYNEKKSARFFFVCKSRKEIILTGPLETQKHNVKKFKKAHKKTFMKGKRIYAREKIDFRLKEFIDNWKKKNARKMREMSVKGLRVV